MSRSSKKQLIGNAGEAFITYKLSRYCLVRPVSSGTDIGIDIFCETLSSEGDDEYPFLHFWVQAKSTASIEIKPITHSQEKIEYWSRQPIPVFIFQTSVDEKLENEGKFRFKVTSISEKIINKRANEQNKNDYEFEITSEDQLKEFIYVKLPEITSRLRLSEGVISVIPTLRKQYVKHLQFKNCHPFSKNILNTIRNAGFLISDIDQNVEKESEELAFRRRHLTEILETFTAIKEWKGKWDIYYHIGLSKEMDCKHETALVMYEKSLHIILIHEKVKNDNSFNDKKKELETRINKLKSLIAS
jgi:hypothetical protein